MPRYFIEILEDGHRLPKGKSQGYPTLEEAVTEAERWVDDALPQNIVLILQRVGHSYLGGDGGTYTQMES